MKMKRIKVNSVVTYFGWVVRFWFIDNDNEELKLPSGRVNIVFLL